MSLLEDRPSRSADVPTIPATRDLSSAAAPRRPPALRELLLIAFLWMAYSVGRYAADGHVSTAFANARRVWDVERFLRMPDEAGLQQLFLHSGPIVTCANYYYAFVHFPATAAFLLWMYLRRPDRYRQARNTLALLTAAALAIHTVFPLAPPRMLARTGMIDTGLRYGPSVYGSTDAGGSTFTNQYAAMPSLHVGWAILLAATIIAFTSGPWRWLWLAHPVITLTVVVGTANHYWVDGIVAGALLLIVWQVAARASFRGRAAEATRAPAPGAIRRPRRDT